MSARSNSERRAPRRVIVVGGGVSGLMTSLELARASVPVLLLSSSEPRRAPSVLDSDGFNAGLDDADVALHLSDTLRTAAGLGEPALLSAMVSEAPVLLDEFLRLGAPFHGTRAKSPGASTARTAFTGSTTGQQILFALDDALRGRGNQELPDRLAAGQAEPLVERWIGWELSGLIQDDDGRIVGVVARDRNSGVVKPFRGEAVCLATGGFAGLYAGACADLHATGSGLALAFRKGAVLADPELVQFRPLAVPGPDKSIGFGELLRAEGARLFRADSEAAKERDVLVEKDQTLDGSHIVRRMHEAGPTFLDLAGLAASDVRRWAGRTLDTLVTLGLGDGMRVPLPVRPAADRTLGGLWVDHEADAGGRLVLASPRNHATTLSGLFAVGECAAAYDGAECLPGNALLSAAFGGRVAARSIAAYAEALPRSAWDLPRSLFEKEEVRERARLRALIDRKGNRELNPFLLREELGKSLARLAFVDRSARDLEELEATLSELQAKNGETAPADGSLHHNQSLSLASTLEDVLLLSRALARAALGRVESRGVHHRSDGQSVEPRHSFVRCEGGEALLVDHFECGVGASRRTVTQAVEGGAS